MEEVGPTLLTRVSKKPLHFTQRPRSLTIAMSIYTQMQHTFFKPFEFGEEKYYILMN